ncbi:MAG: peptide deformylase [Paludibacteraceae bacterium]|nr:peptide deformylase [Paludibacteraceae bacterium]
MVQELNHDLAFLSQKAERATENDKQVIDDLLDTLRTHLDSCVGMAANMIGVNKSIVVFCKGKKQLAMVNPVIVKKVGPYFAEETCLSVPGSKKTVRYNEIEVVYLDRDFVRKREKFSGFTAQIIQHEIDHTNGILI